MPRAKEVTFITDRNGCHICTSHQPNSKEYPEMSRGNKRSDIHRLVWEKQNGPIPKGLFVLHKCDNKRCINPEHLYVGTQKDNVNDELKRGRFAPLLSEVHPRGEDHPNSKLNDDAVREIRNSANVYGERARLAKKFGIDPNTIWSVKNRKSWRHVK